MLRKPAAQFNLLYSAESSSREPTCLAEGPPDKRLSVGLRCSV